MKRSPKTQKSSNPQAEFILKKIDDAVEALQENEDELTKVLKVLCTKELSEKEKEEQEEKNVNYHFFSSDSPSAGYGDIDASIYSKKKRAAYQPCKRWKNCFNEERRCDYLQRNPIYI